MTAAIFSSVPLCVIVFFSSAIFQIFSLSLVLNNFIKMCVSCCNFLRISYARGLLSFLDICISQLPSGSAMFQLVLPAANPSQRILHLRHCSFNFSKSDFDLLHLPCLYLPYSIFSLFSSFLNIWNIVLRTV